jgi:hypothetical protein
VYIIICVCESVGDIHISDVDFEDRIYAVRDTCDVTICDESYVMQKQKATNMT